MITLTLLGATGIVLIDQIIKLIVSVNLSPYDTVNVIPHVLNITYVKNTGAAFGSMQGFAWLFAVITVLVVAVFIYILIAKKPTNKILLVSCSLIIGGAVGNLIDRVFRGFVVDYLQLSFFPPVCNLADYCLCVGAILILIYILFYYKPATSTTEK